MTAEDSNGLFEELGIDLNHPALIDAREDADEYENLLRTLICLREVREMKQSHVADELGTKQSAVSRLEAGMQDARYSTLQKYARVLGGRLRTRVSFDNAWTKRSYHLTATQTDSEPEAMVAYVRAANG